MDPLPRSCPVIHMADKESSKSDLGWGIEVHRVLFALRC